MLSHVMCLTLFLKNTSCFHPLFGVYGGVIKLFSKGDQIKSQIGQSEIFKNWRWTLVFSIWAGFSIRRKGLVWCGVV